MITRTLFSRIVFGGLLIAFSNTSVFAEHAPETYLADVRRARSLGLKVSYDEEHCTVFDIAPTLHGVLETMENEFPKDFFRKGGLKHLHFKRQMTSIDGKFTAGGFGGGDTMVLPAGSGTDRHTLAHEMYHVFSSQFGRSSDEWCRFNHRDFIYKGQRAEMNFNYTEKEKKRFEKRLKNSPKRTANYRVERALGKKAVKQIAKNDQNPEIQIGFVSGYAQTDSGEDRAETFATMYCEQEAFLARAEDSPVLKKKMKFIQEETKNWLGHRYWRAVAEYGTDPKVYVLSSAISSATNSYLSATNSISSARRITIPRTILDEKILVKYHDLKGKIKPGLPVERIMKRLRSDIERAKEAPDSEYMAERKAEALRIAKNVKVYKATLLSHAEELRRRGDIEGVRKTVRLLVDTWPLQKENWLKRFPEAE